MAWWNAVDRVRAQRNGSEVVPGCGGGNNAPDPSRSRNRNCDEPFGRTEVFVTPVFRQTIGVIRLRIPLQSKKLPEDTRSPARRCRSPGDLQRIEVRALKSSVPCVHHLSLMQNQSSVRCLMISPSTRYTTSSAMFVA